LVVCLFPSVSRVRKDRISSGVMDSNSLSLNSSEKRVKRNYCAVCRDTYAPLFDSENDNNNKIIPEHAELKKINPIDDDPSDQFPDISDPVELSAVIQRLQQKRPGQRDRCTGQAGFYSKTF